MKKKILVIATLLIMFIAPVIANAEVKVLNLKDTLADKEIEMKYKDYKETDKQIPIYLFRWTSCSHCKDFLDYLNDITEEYGYMFKLRSYETSLNSDNAEVYDRVAKYFGQKERGVPFIVIGKNTVYGYGKNTGEEVLEYIKEEYNSEEKFDVFDAMEKGITYEDVKKSTKANTNNSNTEENKNSVLPYIVGIGGGVIVIGIIIFAIKRQK